MFFPFIVSLDLDGSDHRNFAMNKTISKVIIINKYIYILYIRLKIKLYNKQVYIYIYIYTSEN